MYHQVCNMIAKPWPFVKYDIRFKLLNTISKFSFHVNCNSSIPIITAQNGIHFFYGLYLLISIIVNVKKVQSNFSLGREGDILSRMYI